MFPFWPFKKARKAYQAFPLQRLAICVPSNRTPTIGFTYSLGQLLLSLRSPNGPLNGWDVALVVSDGSVIHDSREKLVERAVALDSSHLLFLDDDMVFSPAAVGSLLARHRPFVAGNYPRRIPPHHFTASREDETNLIDTLDTSTGLEPAWGVGMGFALITRRVFEAIPKPWFLPGWNAAANTYISEDVNFCRRAREAGFTIYVDHDASKELRHTAARLLSHTDAERLHG